jgi:hypothetical protein
MPATSVFGRFRRQTTTTTHDPALFNTSRSATLSPPPAGAAIRLTATTSLPSHVPEEGEDDDQDHRNGKDSRHFQENLSSPTDIDLSPTNTNLSPTSIDLTRSNSSAPANYGIFPERDKEPSRDFPKDLSRDPSRGKQHSISHTREGSILSLSSSVTQGLRRSVSLRSHSSASPYGHRSRQSSHIVTLPSPPGDVPNSPYPSSLHSQSRKKPSISNFPFFKQAKSAENLSLRGLSFDDAPPVPSLHRFDLGSKNAFPMLTSGAPSLRRHAADRPNLSGQGGGANGAPLAPVPTLQPVNTSGQNPSAVYQSILETTQKRMATIDYLKRVHEGDVYYLTTLHYPPGSVSALPSMNAQKLGRRSTSYYLLGYSLPALLDMNSGSPMEYLKALIALLHEFETYQSLSGTDSASNSLGRGRMGQMFKSSMGMGLGKGRRSSAATDSIALDPQSANFTGFPSGGLGSPQETTSPVNSHGHDFQHLLTPSLPFDPDFGTTFATLCDTMVETYSNLLDLITTPEQCSPSVGEAFAKADKSVRKILVANVMREFEDSTRNGIKSEVAGLGKLVLGGLM